MAMAKKPAAKAASAAAFEPEAYYRVTLKRVAHDGSLKLLPRDKPMIKGKVATRIADAILTAEKV